MDFVNKSALRRVGVSAAVLAVAGGIFAGTSAGQASGPSDAQGASKIAILAPSVAREVQQKSADLVSSPAVSFETSSAGYADVSSLERVGGAMESRTPTPPGYPSDVNWQAAAEQGGDSVAGMQAVVEFNSACKWYRFVVDRGAVDDATAKVLESISNWPSFRGTFKEASARGLASAASSGDTRQILNFIGSNCQ